MGRDLLGAHKVEAELVELTPTEGQGVVLNKTSGYVVVVGVLVDLLGGVELGGFTVHLGDILPESLTMAYIRFSKELDWSV